MDAHSEPLKPGNAGAHQRISAAFSPQAIRAAGLKLSQILADHFENVTSGMEPTVHWRTPEENTAAARTWMDQAEQSGGTSRDKFCEPPDTEQLTAKFADLVRTALSHGLNLHHPHYVGHQVPASVPLAAWFDTVGAITNQVMAIYEMGPWATAVEHAVLEKVGVRLGFQQDSFGGAITSGASLANLTALLTARNLAIQGTWTRGLGHQAMPVLVSHAEAHYSIARAAGILGLGTQQVIPVAIDERRAMDPQHLDETLLALRRKGTPIIAVSAAACATPIGAFDPLHEVADVCARHEVWLHVDAAHGGAACMSRRYRHLVAGLERADSVVCDAHKMFFMPALCALLFYRDGSHRFRAFDQQAPYLFDPIAPELAEYDSGLRVVECSKRAAAFGLWGTWSLFGPQLFEDMVDTTFDLAKSFYQLLLEAEDFEARYEPECNIVVFRYLPRQLLHASDKEIDTFQLRLRRVVVESGSFYLVSHHIDGRYVLRVTLINPLTDSRHLQALLDELRCRAALLLDDST
ncbi:MAG: pyridoxal-dependent decarboxylase [Planctomycetaceae bacterium]|nr:pyridoxal-dependent decarboxylase [Planctomycetaceae bacterium]MBP62112.1 pyridoxal-dependent decarboxylase [Planctomycetaceae bacterium]